MQKDFTRAIRHAFLVFLVKHQALQHFTVIRIDLRDTAIQRVGGVECAAVRRADQTKVFQVEVSRAGALQRGSIKTVDHAAADIFKSLRAGDIEGVFCWQIGHFIQTFTQLALNQVIGAGGLHHHRRTGIHFFRRHLARRQAEGGHHRQCKCRCTRTEQRFHT